MHTLLQPPYLHQLFRLLFVIFYILHHPSRFFFFFFNDTATTEIYTLSLHDALPIFDRLLEKDRQQAGRDAVTHDVGHRSEEHTSELQSHLNLVCRLLLEKKKRRE